MQQFQKWEWIEAKVSKANKDHRPESYKIDVNSIIRGGEIVKTSSAWAERRKWIGPHIVGSMAELERRRQNTGETLGFIRPGRLIELKITPAKGDWTEKDKINLARDGLFDSAAIRSRPPLRKVPFDFYYVYEDGPQGSSVVHQHKITDWEAGALFWNCFHDHGDRWEAPFRQKLETEFLKKDLLFLMGTVHQFPDIWLIVGLFYPPHQTASQQTQLALPIRL